MRASEKCHPGFGFRISNGHSCVEASHIFLKKALWRMSASLASPGKVGWRMLTNVSSPASPASGHCLVQDQTQVLLHLICVCYCVRHSTSIETHSNKAVIFNRLGKTNKTESINDINNCNKMHTKNFFFNLSLFVFNLISFLEKIICKDICRTMQDQTMLERDHCQCPQSKQNYII